MFAFHALDTISSFFSSTNLRVNAKRSRAGRSYINNSFSPLFLAIKSIRTPCRGEPIKNLRDLLGFRERKRKKGWPHGYDGLRKEIISTRVMWDAINGLGATGGQFIEGRTSVLCLQPFFSHSLLVLFWMISSIYNGNLIIFLSVSSSRALFYAH